MAKKMNIVTMIKQLFGVGGVTIPMPEHIENQKRNRAPFYCGTAFCSHSTMRAAAECWQAKMGALDGIRAECKKVREQGKGQGQEAFLLEMSGADRTRYYPELDPNNWPINRSSQEMRREYIEKAKAEGGVG